MERQRFLGLLDMLDGGGAGRAGDTFEGGPLSGFLNALGIRPMGYRDRMAQMAQARPMPRPAGLGAAPRPAPQPQLGPFALQPGMTNITQTTLPPMGQMSDADLIAIIQRALQAPPPAIGYGPR